MRPVEFPAADDRLVQPETGTEMIHGEVRHVLPAESPHADRQCDISYVIRSHVAPGYVASTELLTRVDDASDFATDACIRRAGLDPATGERYLEELSFEVKHTQTDLEERARMLIRRGVRRVFVLYVKGDGAGGVEAGPVREWLANEDGWLELAPSAVIEDECLVAPIRAQALIDATEANNQVARALLAQGNPVLVEDKQKALEARDAEHARQMEARDAEHARQMEARDAEHARQMEALIRATEARITELEAQAREAILDLCALLAIEVTAEQHARMEAMSSEELAALRSALRRQRRWPQS